MKNLLMSLFLFGCAHHQYPIERIAIVHDYIIERANELCAKHRGLHYIVTHSTIFNGEHKDPHKHDYDCTEFYKFRCQDGFLPTYHSEVKWCGISESQISDALTDKCEDCHWGDYGL